MDLAWTDNATDETNFEVERSTGAPAVSFSLLATLGAVSVSYTDTGLSPADEYCYRVRAANGAGHPVTQYPMCDHRG